METILKKDGQLVLIPENDEDKYWLQETAAAHERGSARNKKNTGHAIIKALERDWHSLQYEAQALTAIKSGMQAENQAMDVEGKNPIYGEKAFGVVADKFRAAAKRMDELAVHIYSVTVPLYPGIEGMIDRHIPGGNKNE